MAKKIKGPKGNNGSGLLGKATRAKKRRRTSVMDMVNAGMGKRPKSNNKPRG